MKILIISASQRAHSNSLKASNFIKLNVLNNLPDIDSSILDLSQYPFLLDNYGVEKEDKRELNQNKEDVLSQLYKCDAVVFVVPEWGGMIPPALVNLLLLCANGSANGLPLGHKPAFAIGISTSSGGSNPISLLKAYAAKNTHLTWLPLHAIIQNVDTFLATDWAPNNDSRYNQVQSRVLTGLTALTLYAKQLKTVRKELVELSKIHPFGQ
ncbi:NAD(P)H-dependent oxidoreductase [Pseudoalteromonas denitrificans]|uniref:NAD(P)H-dependent FMN reductase n=1 Tax=Pseudoalteromonas denitrificans DSM 6059 TaxID=1123010 RepID=A0A1I1G481_9GAMM|nr:NAD(P)H-dependent oxidoreductase [Pseudoalteromonas denitrificans]SFC06557.1 NAD(P)H-dependent FMN reductase [Pseudoalteromonas denitrificans DSM 6059]